MAGEDQHASDFVADGTADPAPDRWYPDATAGLVAADTPSAEPQNLAELDEGVPVTAVDAPDAESVRHKMEAVLAGEQEDEDQQPPQRSQRRGNAASRRESAQPGRLPVGRREPGAAGQRGRGPNSGWPSGNRPPRPRRRPTKPVRKQPALVIVIALILVVVFFNVLSALFEWLNTAFH